MSLYIPLGNNLINANKIYQIVSISDTSARIITFERDYFVTDDDWTAIKNLISTYENLYYLEGYGYLNLENIMTVGYDETNISYAIRFMNIKNETIITNEKVPNLDDTLFNVVKQYQSSQGGGGSGVSLYAQLPDKPQINNVTLEGNKTLADLNINIPDSYTKIESNGLYIKVADKESTLSGTEGKLPDSKAIKEAIDTAIENQGTTDYTELINKPQINNVELDGNKTSADLNILSSDTIVQTLDGNETDKVPSVQVVKTYVDTKDGETLNSAKQYTDQKIAEIVGGGTIDLESYDEIKAYTASIKLNQDDLVIYQDKLYIVKTAIENTTTWETDSVNFVAVVNLDNYYDKDQANTNFIPKADILDTLDGNEADKVASVQAIKSAMDNITIDLSTDIEADQAVENKAPTTKAVFDYTYSKADTDAKIDEKIAELVIPDDVKLYEASIELDQNTLVIYNDELYIVKTAVPNTTTWDVDNVNFVKVNKDIVSIDYEIIENKPQVNGIELVGNKTSADLSLLSVSDIVQTLDGDETNKVPSVITVKTAIENSQKELSNDIETDKDNQEKVTTPKAVYDFVQANTLTTENDGVYDITKIGKYYELYKRIRLQDGVINTQELKEIKVLEDTSINIVHASVCIDAHNLLISTIITDKTVNLIAINMSDAPIDYRSIDVSLRILSTVKPDNGYVPLEPELKDAKLGTNDEYGEDPYNPEDTKTNKAISTSYESIILNNSLDIPVELNGATYEAVSNNEFVTVEKTDTNLKLNAVSAGNSIITVTFTKQGFLDKIRKLYIVSSKVDPDLQVTPTELNITATQTDSINITGTAAWTAVSKATDIATVDKPSGTGADTITVSALKKGNTTIEIDVAETEDTSAKKFIVNITIIGKESDLTATPESITVEMGETAKITISGTPTYTTDSENDGVATIDGEGNITPVSEGSTNLYINSVADDIWNEKTITIPCTVNKKTPDTNLNKTDIEIATTETGIVSVTQTVPESGWTARIENTGIATVNTSEGVGNTDLTITGVTPGTTKLIVESKDDTIYGKVTKECTVVIKDRVQLIFPDGDIVTSPNEPTEIAFQSDANLEDISATLEDDSFGTVEVVQG